MRQTALSPRVIVPPARLSVPLPKFAACAARDRSSASTIRPLRLSTASKHQCASCLVLSSKPWQVQISRSSSLVSTSSSPSVICTTSEPTSKNVSPSPISGPRKARPTRFHTKRTRYSRSCRD
ncbi:hypothetical protein MPH_01592 [Macrophomina phaseolina MS6]|uniref:Uncharacterized protein n=1 Tax=Macrophomina phaseolina (strain MS6) TaxID=1126212 RepID=K2SX35_MACPH|nr:hypothetical protein MPH_01592 [Macrophomina phaseolina MS6]